MFEMTCRRKPRPLIHPNKNNSNPAKQLAVKINTEWQAPYLPIKTWENKDTLIKSNLLHDT